MTTRYIHPSRKRPPEYAQAIAWWQSLPELRRVALRRERGLRTVVAIVEYRMGAKS
jgi:hypothetical protein